ncbi:MAG: prephenate dehydrogenase [Bacteroidetes bacterium]|nr:prephenate dehydrogenase [Bacteroidota bacterium]
MVVGIIGLGLIGGSLAISLKNKNGITSILGVDNHPEHLKKAMSLGLADEIVTIDEVVGSADFIIVATPMDSMVNIIPSLLSAISKHQIVMDVGSTKVQLAEAVKSHPNRNRYVAAHPMAGTEFSGPEAAIPDLFEGKYTVLCDVELSAPDALKMVRHIFDVLNMKIVELDSRSHDIHTAYVSHISHISSFALALTVLAKEKDENRIFELAGSGFSSTVRLAKSSPDTWIPIFRQNRDNVLDVLDEHINQLSQFRSLLIKNDFDTFHTLIEEANAIKRIIS